MAPFDVYANPTAASRDGYPYLVVLQSDQLDHLSMRLVMPLQRLGCAPVAMPGRLAQMVLIAGETLRPAAHQCAAMPARWLRKPIATLTAEQATLRDVIDAAVSGVV
jgi:toxin CcdB